MKQNFRRLLAVVLVVCVLGAALALGGSAYMVLSVRSQVLSDQDSPPEDLDCILVLGCGLYADGTPKPMLADRITESLTLYTAGWSPTLLFTGDNAGPDYNEVGAMEQAALEAGVSSQAMVLDGQGYSTYESLYRAKYVYGMERVVIVTQGYHLSRALYLANALGLEAWGVSASLRHYPGQIRWSVREVLARDKDLFTALTLPAVGES